MLIHNKDDIEFVTEFPCFLGHPVALIFLWSLYCKSMQYTLKAGRFYSLTNQKSTVNMSELKNLINCAQIIKKEEVNKITLNSRNGIFLFECN